MHVEARDALMDRWIKIRSETDIRWEVTYERDREEADLPPEGVEDVRVEGHLQEVGGLF